MFLELVNGVAILLALCLLYAFNAHWLHHKQRLKQIAAGLMFGTICIIGMMKPVTLAPGAIFDARSVILSMAGLFCGPLAALIAATLAAGYRLWVGGIGASVGVSVIAASTVLGLIYGYCRDRGWIKTGALQLLIFGAAVHLIAILLFTSLPAGVAQEVMHRVALPYTLIFALATVLLGLLLQYVETRSHTELALRQSEARYARVMAGSDQGFWEWNLQTQEFNVSPRYETMLGYAPGEMPLAPEDWHLHVHPEDFPKARASIDRHCKSLSTAHEVELRCRTKSGDWKWILTRGSIVAYDAAGQPLIMSGTHTDISARRAAEMALQESEQQFRQQTQRLEEVIWGTDAGTWEWNLQTDEAQLNQGWAQMVGYTLEELQDLCGGTLTRTGLAQLVHPDDVEQAYEQMRRYFDGATGIFSCETRMRHKNGHWIWVLARGRAVERAEDGKPLRMSGTHQDITARKISEEKLRQIAHYDLLTGLPNRVLLADRLQQAMALCLRRQCTVAVAYLDLDGFKDVNDRYSHAVGDEMLIALSQRFKSSMREVDTLARIGGDEFAAVLVDLDHPDDCAPALERLLRAATEPVVVRGITLQLSASIGVTLYPQDAGDADQLLRHADQAMYLAKQAGKNRYQLFDVDQAAEMEAQRDNLLRIRLALSQHEFVLHYQPKVNMSTGQIIGAEALIRWQHPERGLLPPSEFLPVIENHVFGVDLGEWVIDTALSQMAAWQADGLAIPISVNVSAGQLQQAGFVSRLSHILSRHPSIRPESLELEILETSALNDMANVSATMHACRKLGVRFALDDFGTGYASLTYLKHLPADVLKIDQTFVRDILDDPDDLAIVEGIMGLANAFRRHAIAEGVETIAHGEMLLALGCEQAQGYVIARPMPADELRRWAGTWEPSASWKAQHQRPSTPDEQMVTYAEVKHRHWQREISAFLAGARNAPPHADAHISRLDHWLQNAGRERYRHHPDYHAVIALHDQVHALGRELLEMRPDDQSAQRLEALRQLQEEMLAKLRRMVSSQP